MAIEPHNILPRPFQERAPIALPICHNLTPPSFTTPRQYCGRACTFSGPLFRVGSEVELFCSCASHARSSSALLSRAVGSEEKRDVHHCSFYKAIKPVRLCDIEGFDSLDNLLIAEITDTVCPAICMTERCDHTAKIEPDQDQGYCEACGGNTVVSVPVLADLI